MPDPVVIPAEGTILSWGVKPPTGTATLTETAQILNIKPPGGEVASVSTSHLKSTSKTYRPGKIPGVGEVTFRIELNPADASHQAILDQFDTPADMLTFKITYNDGKTTPGTDVFDGFFTKYEPDSLEDEKNFEADLTIQVSGGVTRTPGASS